MNIEQFEQGWWRGERLLFEDKGPISKYAATRLYRITCNGQFLGTVRWFSRWRKYVFYTEDIILDDSCMEEIITFLRDRNIEQKEGWKKQSVVKWDLVSSWKNTQVMKTDGRGVTIWTKDPKEQVQEQVSSWENEGGK